LGKFLGRRLDPIFVARDRTRRRQMAGVFVVFPLSHWYYIFRFSNEEDMLRVHIGGPWVIFGQVLALESWRFLPSKELIKKTIVSLHLPEGSAKRGKLY